MLNSGKLYYIQWDGGVVVHFTGLLLWRVKKYVKETGRKLLEILIIKNIDISINL